VGSETLEKNDMSEINIKLPAISLASMTKNSGAKKETPGVDPGGQELVRLRDI